MLRTAPLFFRAIALCFSTLASTAETIIIESPKLKTVFKYISKKDARKTLVAFDLDETLITSELGDPFFSHLWKKEMKKGLTNPDEIVPNVLPDYYFGQTHLDLQPAEKGIPRLLKKLKRKKVTIMGLTSRSGPIIDYTVGQLDKLNIDLTLCPPSKKEFALNFRLPATYKNGTVFCGNNDKGELLFYFFDKAGCSYPEKIIFFDDKLKNVESVERAAEKRGIEFVGVRYSGMDEMVKNFDAEKAECKLAELKKKFPEDVGKAPSPFATAAAA